jgi:LCP family protein required for cell wall assembly
VDRNAEGPGRSIVQKAPVKPRKRHRFRNWSLAIVALVVLSLGAFLLWAQSRIVHVDALSGAPDTPGQTYLIVGSDSREGWADDGTTGARTDTIMILHQPVSGPTALISIPRDSYVDIPGHGRNKINAAFAFGGPVLLVQTVEDLTGLTIDRYIEIGFTGVSDVVNALGGVELCYDKDVNDPYSTLVWTAGCHEVDGTTALAFSRMRYSDPIGDIGRTQRQQQLVDAVAAKVLRPSTLLNPFAVFRISDAALASLRVSNGMGILDLAQAARAFASARGDGAVTGTPPLVSLDYRVDGVGSTVLLDPDTIDDFWRQIADGSLPPGPVGGWGSG